MQFNNNMTLTKTFDLNNNDLFEFFLIKKDEKIDYLLNTKNSSSSENYRKKIDAITFIFNIISDNLYRRKYSIDSSDIFSLDAGDSLFSFLETFDRNSYNFTHLLLKDKAYFHHDNNIIQGFFLKDLDNESLLLILPQDKDILFDMIISSVHQQKKKIDITTLDLLTEELFLPSFFNPVSKLNIYTNFDKLNFYFTKDEKSMLKSKPFFFVPLHDYLYFKKYDDLDFILKDEYINEMVEKYINYLFIHYDFPKDKFSYFVSEGLLFFIFDVYSISNEPTTIENIITALHECVNFDRNSLKFEKVNNTIILLCNRYYSDIVFNYLHMIINLDENEFISDINFFFSLGKEKDISHNFDLFLNKKLLLEAPYNGI